MLKATTHHSPSSNLLTLSSTSKPLVPCRPNSNRTTSHVHFPLTLTVGPGRHPAALQVCNKLLDKFPTTGAIDSGATDHFLPLSFNSHIEANAIN
jgi:hypothetical protein